MSKNVVHNFDLSIKNSTDINSSEELTKTIIKELAKVSQEMNQQKDIIQLWQEQKSQNATAVTNNSSSLTEGGATDTTATSEKLTSVSNTSSVSGETISSAISSGTISNPNALIGGGVADNTGGTRTSATSANTTSPTSGAENNSVNFNNGVTTQTYANVSAQQTLNVPQIFHASENEPTIEVIKAEIKKKLDAAIAANDTATINYWTSISKAFDEGATTKDFDGKPNDMLFTQMFAILKQSNLGIVATQNFDWDIVRKKMIDSIDANILKGKISDISKKRWETIRKQLTEDNTNVTNLFEQYDELFLLLKEVEGLDTLPNTITITTKTKIYPNLSADKLYAAIGKEDVYVFLKGISDMRGRAVDKGAVKIKNTTASSFIVGESLEFTLDETFIKQKLFQKENINWIVYRVENKESTIFRDKGTSFSYNFDKAGIYRIDAYGKNPTVKGNKNAPESTFIELKIEAQQIIITSSGITKDGQTRTSTKEKLFKIALKYPKVKTLNPLKLYYQVETKTDNKVTVISEEQELDSKGIVKFPMPNLGEYSIKVTSKDQYALNKEYKINAIKNEVTSIGEVEKASKIGRFLLGDSNNTLTLEAKTFKINPATDEEKEDIKWIIYDSNNKPYLPSGSVVLTDDNNPKKAYLHKWSSFDVPLPKKEGHYTVEAYSDTKKGAQAKSIFNIEMTRPQVTEAHWASGGGSKKETSGFEGESNWIKANIPYYNNQTVRIYFYLDTKKAKYYLDVKTNERGEIFQEIKFDSNFQKQIGFQNSKKAKVGFKVLGIQNGKPYPFKTPTNYESDTVLSVTTGIKILDAYFMYDDKRVTSQDEIPFDKKGTTLTIVAKTQNMVGKEIVLTAHKVGEKPAFRHRVIVNSEGVAITSFVIMPAKGLKNGSINKYYVGVEGYSTRHLNNKVVNMVVGASVKPVQEKKEIIFPLLEKPTNDTNSKWGKNYNWTDDDGHNQATFDSYRDHGKRKHAARDLYTEPKAVVIAIADGEVLEVRSFYSGTYQVTILHKLKDGRKFIARYGELNPNSIKVKKGDVVKQKKVIGETGKLQGVTVINGQDIYMLHFEIFSAEKEDNLNHPLTNKINGSPFQRRKDLVDSIDILLEGYKNTFEINKEDRKDVKLLKISDKGKQFIKDWELYKKKMYDNDGDNNSSGNCTIGYGHLIHTGKCDGSTSEDKFKNGISENEASKLLETDILIFEKVIKNKIKTPLHQYEYDALVSYVYNIGPAFKAPNLIKFLNSKNYVSAVFEIETGSQNTKRRKQERDMFSKGIYDSTH